MLLPPQLHPTLDPPHPPNQEAERIRTTRYSTNDVEIQVNVRPDTPKEVYDLRLEVSVYQRRLQELNKETAEKEHNMELRASKAESNLEFLQRHILKLHRGLFNTLHLVYKHRYRWTTRLPDPMRTLHIPEVNKEKSLEVSYNMKLGELLQADRDFMDTFGTYMVSDEYGANAVVDQAPLTRSMRRRSFGGFSSLERAESTQVLPTRPRHEDPVAKLPKAPAGRDNGISRLRRSSDQDPLETVEKVPDLGERRESSLCVPLKRGGSNVGVRQEMQVAGGIPRTMSQLSSLPSFAQPIGRLKRKASITGKQCYFTATPEEDPETVCNSVDAI